MVNREEVRAAGRSGAGAPTADEVNRLPYVELLARLRESNRPPGGIDTVRRLVVNCHLRPGTDVLHAGCNAGFLSRELARRSGCRVLGIDISEAMVEAATKRASHEGLQDLVRHERQDMRGLDLNGLRFDVVLSGGALAFVDGHRRAVEQWIEAVKPFGLVADAELYYREPPPDELLEKVSDTIGVRVPRYDRAYWTSVFDHELLERYYSHEGAVETASEAQITAYCERMVEHSAGGWGSSPKEALFERLLRTFKLFDENLKFMGYQILVYRRLPRGAEPALYA